MQGWLSDTKSKNKENHVNGISVNVAESASAPMQRASYPVSLALLLVIRYSFPSSWPFILSRQ